MMMMMMIVVGELSTDLLGEYIVATKTTGLMQTELCALKRQLLFVVKEICTFAGIDHAFEFQYF